MRPRFDHAVLRIGLLNISASALAACGPLAGLSSASRFVERPPDRYLDDPPGVRVVQIPTGDIADLCGQIVDPHSQAYSQTRGRTVVACEKDGVVFLPNACEWRDPYAQIVCHETAHANGWPADHPTH